MAMNVGQDGGDPLVSSINTTPLVDVMLVLLIIFLITIPVATQTVPVALPKETNDPRQAKIEDINLSVTRDGAIYWNAAPISLPVLRQRFAELASATPQPMVQVYGDASATYLPVGRIVRAAQDAGIQKLGFVTEPMSNP
ncbi:biopolymer transporter ExbD [Paracidovorax avenae]|uniref:Biopolymer transport protein ExbD/TolR n=1 Tax=Paracidovorax avenae (strain ATCC 19860 / DSM 7227 / CCUG 15838 / JCM 20985 / LMG 2117 / NCPPB 1011) TaxID=643561 RepID=F0QC96_PARA1|nr:MULTISPECIES: biopolymer transporter ExbD [Comamonadaceae]ADX46187.1 Biopolymer transport protein ExbD/TolR [Paracidovorax avenae ATCC 19860]AVS67587.1 biopolymer transporter ExbD [Paracidovorax avenae]AVS81207.1 biopolymer transporter ExbD [Paracidovorax avenae]AVT16424.1 biopolymer transporter ExbD [Paracidovorax avenae]MDA8449650.1 biopolymer transporter ExbD [Acidovorax sp. GBBC 3297]